MEATSVKRGVREIKLNLYFDDLGQSLQQIMEKCVTHYIPRQDALDANDDLMYNNTDE